MKEKRENLKNEIVTHKLNSKDLFITIKVRVVIETF